MNRTGFLIVFFLSALAPSLTPAATGRILDEVEAQQADTTALTAEAELFKSIGLGIALSLAQCEEQTACAQTVSKDELGHLLDTLDKRINFLVSRQEQKEDDYTEVLTAYVTQRENYLRYQADLERITGGSSEETTATVDESAPVDTTAVETPPAETVKEETGESGVDMDVFSDVEEELE